MRATRRSAWWFLLLVVAPRLAGGFQPLGQALRRVEPVSATAAYTIDAMEVPGPLVPLTNFLLVKKDEGRGTTSGGLILAKAAKASSGTVAAVGPGKEHKESGKVPPRFVDVGDRVTWGRYAGAEFKYCGQEHTLLKDTDITLMWNGDGDPTLDTARVPPGKVLLKVIKKAASTNTGIIFDAFDRENDVPLEGEVAKVCGGAYTRDAVALPLDLTVGDCVRFRDYDTKDVKLQGDDYVIIDANVCICKWQKKKVPEALSE